jgi:hypothetical protein
MRSVHTASVHSRTESRWISRWGQSAPPQKWSRRQGAVAPDLASPPPAVRNLGHDLISRPPSLPGATQRPPPGGGHRRRRHCTDPREGGIGNAGCGMIDGGVFEGSAASVEARTAIRPEPFTTAKKDCHQLPRGQEPADIFVQEFGISGVARRAGGVAPKRRDRHQCALRDEGSFVAGVT